MTFEVSLSEPFSGFEAVLGYSGFFPVAQECLDDFDACNESPIGNGPYKIDGEWEHNVQIKLSRNEEYAGEDTGKPDTLVYRIFDSVDTAYAAFQGGELDVMYTVPPNKLAEVKQNYSDTLLQQPSDSLHLPRHAAVPEAVRQHEAPPGLLDGHRPAGHHRRHLRRLAVAGHRLRGSVLRRATSEGVCEYCEYDPERAKELFDEAGGFDGKLQLWANGGCRSRGVAPGCRRRLQEHLRYRLRAEGRHHRLRSVPRARRQPQVHRSVPPRLGPGLPGDGDLPDAAVRHQRAPATPPVTPTPSSTT